MNKFQKTLIGLIGATAGAATELSVDPIDISNNQTVETISASLISGLIALLLAEVRSWFKRRQEKKRKNDGQMQ